MGVLGKELATLISRWRTWFLMANQDIQLRYKRSLLGPFWISIAMATTVGSIALLYSEVMKVPFSDFLPWFGAGLMAWVLMTSMITEGCSILSEHESHLRAVQVPLPVMAARVVHRNLIVFIHNALVILCMFWLLGVQFQPVAVLSVLAFLIYVPLGWFSVMLLGPVCARFRDLAQVVASIIQVMFFFTPIFWIPSSALSRPIVVDGNPFYHLVQLLRAPLLGQSATLLNWQVSIAFVFVLGCAAMISLVTTRRKIYLWL